jgi:AcrR family transcriptional regulator
MSRTAKSAPATPGRPAGPGAAPARRRRGDELRKAIFDAVFQQVNETGYAALTMDRLASAADTSKAVLYRHWESKDALVVDALRNSLPAADEPAPGPDLRADLLTVLDRMRAAVAATRGAAFRVIAAESGGACHLLAEERVFGPARAAILAALRRAADRGECEAALVSEAIADVGPALLRAKALDGPVPSEAVVAGIVDEVLVPLYTGYRRP